jgi:hypothetical protein
LTSDLQQQPAKAKMRALVDLALQQSIGLFGSDEAA